MRIRHVIAGTVLSLAAGGVAHAGDLFVNQWRFPICTNGCLPDVVAEYEPYGNSQGFRVYNASDYAAGKFHIAVIAPSGDGYGIDVAGIPAHGSVWYGVHTSYAGEPFTVILNTFNAMPESNYNNNSLTFNGWANID
jgi:hypothetical protein